uniref:Tripartite motif-containing protein 2-like n=1 Tax=Crassostrea virginica TaxID=6565 RepID=A0A8B8AJD7_CRAVI|nr:tripartite motif-containing protein 2-like [Crassostrea virginica]
MAEAFKRKEDQLLNCGICEGRLTDPRILDCLHSFCKECLVIKQEQAAIKDVVVCQLCQQSTDLPDQSLDSLTRNVFVTNIGRVDEIVNSNRSFYCSFCDDQGKTESASSRCLTCGDWLCLVCAGRHCGTTITKRHKVVTIDDIRVNSEHLNELRKLLEIKCHSHDERIIQFCTQCNKPICLECISSDHKHHDSMPLEDAVDLVHDDLSDLQRMFAEVEEVDSESEMQISKRLQEVRSKESSLVQHLHDTRDRLIQDIQQQAEAAELAISQKFEDVRLFLTEASNTASNISRNTEKSRLFCERLRQEGLQGECIHFKDLLKRVKRDGNRREQLEFPSIPDVNLKVSDFSLPAVFDVLQSDQSIIEPVVAQKQASGEGQNKESIQVTLGPQKQERQESNFPLIERITEPKTENVKDFIKSGLSVKVSNEDPDDYVDDLDYEDCSSEDESNSDVSDNDQVSEAWQNRPPIAPAATPMKQKPRKESEADDDIWTINVKECNHVSLTISSDRNKTTAVSDISWLTRTEFAAGDRANQKIKVFNKNGELSWSKDVTGASLERLACVDGVIAFDYHSGVRLETRTESFTKIYCYADNRTSPYPITKTIGKEVIISNRDFSDLRCYTTRGKRSRYLSLGRKIDINYISMNERSEFLFTERNSNLVKTFLDGQGVSVFYKGLPDMVLEGIATDSGNNVYVSDSAGSDILKLSPAGKLLGILEVHPPSPQGMSISSDDHLLVCDGEGNAWIIHL